MINFEKIISQLTNNQLVVKNMLSNLKETEITFRPHPKHWCLLEIICHLVDEEREDFRARIQSILENPSKPLTPFNPVLWVTERKYMEQNFEEKLSQFLDERNRSIEWLNELKNPAWENAYLHPILGRLTAQHFLHNWLAHDYLHIRQINRVKYEYLNAKSGEDLSYAGNW